MPRWPGFLLAGLLVGLMLWSDGNHFLDGRYAKADLRAAAASVARENPGGDPDALGHRRHVGQREKGIGDVDVLRRGDLAGGVVRIGRLLSLIHI